MGGLVKKVRAQKNTLHVKHEAHVAAAAPCAMSEPTSGASEPPSAASPYFRPVEGLMSASIAALSCRAMTGIDENTVKISAPTAPSAMKQVLSTATGSEERGAWSVERGACDA